MLKRRHFSVDTSSPCRDVQVSMPALGRQNGVFQALGRPEAPVASTLQNLLGTRSVDAEVSTSPGQAARQTLPADKRLRRFSGLFGRTAPRPSCSSSPNPGLKATRASLSQARVDDLVQRAQLLCLTLGGDHR
jgi:hypothetical protein